VNLYQERNSDVKAAQSKSVKTETEDLDKYKSIVRLLILTNVLFAAFFVFSIFDTRLVPGKMDYENFISVILTALGVILAALALGLGALAVVGWQTFESNVQRRVGEVIGEVLQSGFQKNGELRPFLEQAVDKVSYDILVDSKQEMELSEDDVYAPNDPEPKVVL
jgi:hypothetical protein